MAFNFGGGGAAPAKNGAEKQQGGETKGHDPFDEKIIMGDLIDLGALVPMKHLVVDQEVRLDCSQIHCYEAITIKDKGILTTEAYKKDKSSGILRIRCLGNVIIEKGGKIDVSELGWKGGKNNGLSADGIDVSGMSLGGKLGTCDKKPNHGGGGGGESSSKYGSSAGAGAGYGTKGDNAEDNKYSGKVNPGGLGGETYSDENLALGLVLGSGGGAGTLYSNKENDINKYPHGGHGGGALELLALEVTIEEGGGIYSNGQDGVSGSATCK